MAILNATPGQAAARNVERIKTLDKALVKPGASAERKASLQAERDRRMDELRTLKAALAEVDGL
jgi:hypothetical protein